MFFWLGTIAAQVGSVYYLEQYPVACTSIFSLTSLCQVVKGLNSYALKYDKNSYNPIHKNQ